MTKEGYTKIVNFMTPGTGVLALGYGHISHSENALLHDPQAWGSDGRAWPYKSLLLILLTSTLSIYSALIAIVLRDYDAAFLYHR